MVQWNVGAVNVLHREGWIGPPRARHLIKVHSLLRISDEVPMCNDTRLRASCRSATEVEHGGPRTKSA
jgi:hypothetical protein